MDDLPLFEASAIDTRRSNDRSAVDSALPPIESIIPHRGSMLLLDAVAAVDDTSIEAIASVWGDAWYADAQGAMPVWIGIELMAQAIAAHVGLLSLREGRPARPGVLLGARRYEAHVPFFVRDAVLSIRATEMLRGESGHGAYACTIEHDGLLCARATVKVFQPLDFQSFIEEGFRS